eukprot:6354367-Pyramimonas_sp.AAC.1
MAELCVFHPNDATATAHQSWRARAPAPRVSPDAARISVLTRARFLAREQCQPWHGSRCSVETAPECCRTQRKQPSAPRHATTFSPGTGA